MSDLKKQLDTSATTSFNKMIDEDRGLPDTSPSSEFLNSAYTPLRLFSVSSNQEINFYAFITKFKDSYKQSWKFEDVYGRMDPIGKYAGTGRKVSVSWDIPAFGRVEAWSNLSKISSLIKMQYPGFREHFSGDKKVASSATTIATPPLFRVKFGNWLTKPNTTPGSSARSSGVLCAMDGVDFEPLLEHGTFLADRGFFLPKSIRISAELIVFHEHLLGWDENHLGRTEEMSEFSENDSFPYLIKTAARNKDLEDGEVIQSQYDPNCELGISSENCPDLSGETIESVKGEKNDELSGMFDVRDSSPITPFNNWVESAYFKR